jgi:hypothetical protein
MDKNKEDQNNSIKMRPINYNFPEKKEKLFLKENNSSELFNNIKDDLLFKAKLKNKAENNKDNEKDKNEIFKEIFSKTENIFYKKKSLIFYQSPFFIPFKSHYILSPKIQVSSKKRKADLNDTNSLLKY